MEQTECSVEQLSFQGVGKRQIVARFDGGQLSSDGGGLLLREVERRTGLLSQFAACFRDYRNPKLVEHSLKSLITTNTIPVEPGRLNSKITLLTVAPLLADAVARIHDNRSVSELFN